MGPAQGKTHRCWPPLGVQIGPPRWLESLEFLTGLFLNGLYTLKCNPGMFPAGGLFPRFHKGGNQKFGVRGGLRVSGDQILKKPPDSGYILPGGKFLRAPGTHFGVFRGFPILKNRTNIRVFPPINWWAIWDNV